MITVLFFTKVPKFDTKINQQISNLCCEKIHYYRFCSYNFILPPPRIQQGRQCTCSVTLRHVRATSVAVENQEVVHILWVYL